MRRTYPLSLNEAISLRQAVQNATPSYPLVHIRTAWVGICKEVVDALYGSSSHIVERHEGRLHIWRKGYTAPHFIEVGGGAFCCPYWSYGRKND